jgi:hypothetical protein
LTLCWIGVAAIALVKRKPKVWQFIHNGSRGFTEVTHRSSSSSLHRVWCLHTLACTCTDTANLIFVGECQPKVDTNPNQPTAWKNLRVLKGWMCWNYLSRIDVE